MKRSPKRVLLRPAGHAVYELDDGVLLVFKPAGHMEPSHSPPSAQQLRVLRGRLRIDAEAQSIVLDMHSEALSIAGGQAHATEALDATWLIADSRAEIFPL
jgi:hypothetical protein